MAESDGSSLSSKLEEELTCSICSEQFQNPKALPCLHSFCHDCLVASIQDNTITCPVCQQNLEINNPPDISFLPCNFTINNILTAMATSDGKDGSVVTATSCVNCDSKPEYNCTECCKLLCHMCGQSHMSSEDSEKHTLILLDEVDTSSKAVTPKDSVTCPKHNKTVTWSCHYCKTNICEECTSSEVHLDHSCQPLVDVKEKQVVENLLGQVKNKQKQFSEHLDKVKKSEGDLVLANDNVVAEIGDFFDNIIDLMKKRKEDLIEQATVLFNKRKKEFLEPIEHLETNLTKCENVIVNGEQALNNGNGEDISKAKTIIEEGLVWLSKTSFNSVDKKQPAIKFVSHYTAKEIEDVFLKRCCILGNVAAPKMCTAVIKYPQSTPIIVGKPCAVTVTCRDYLNNAMTCGGQLVTPVLTGVKVDGVSVIDNEDGTYDALFTAKEIGFVTFQVMVNRTLAKRCQLTLKVVWNLRENIGNGNLSDGGLTLSTDSAFGTWCYRVGGYIFTTGVHVWRVSVKYTGEQTTFSHKRKVEIGVVDGVGDLSYGALKNHHTRRWVGVCDAEVVATVRLDMDHHVLLVQFSGGTDTKQRSVAPTEFRYDVKAEKVSPFIGLQGKHCSLTISPMNKKAHLPN